LERLSQRDLSSLLRFLQKVYAIRGLDSLPAQVGSAIAQVIPNDYYAYTEIDTHTRTASAVMTEPAIDAILPNHWEIFERCAHEHPLLGAHQHYVGALKISDFLSQRQFCRLALYNEFFKPAGVRYQMSVTIPGKPGLLTGSVVNRTQRDFSERERLLLDLVRPHLAQAYQNAEAFTVMRQAQRVGGREVICFDRGGRIRYAGDVARSWMATYFQDLTAQENRLPDPLERWLREQLDRFCDESDARPPASPVVVDQDDKRLVIRYVPGDEDGQQEMISLEEQRLRISPASLTALGISHREAEVLSWAAQGKSVAEISQMLCISIGTVEKHVERIYTKLGVHSRTAAVARVFRALKQ